MGRVVRWKVMTTDVAVWLGSPLQWHTSVWLLDERPETVADKLPGDQGCPSGSLGILDVYERLPHSHLDRQSSGGGIHQPSSRSLLTCPAEGDTVTASLGRSSIPFSLGSPCTTG